MENNKRKKIIWEEKYVPVPHIIKGLILIVPFSCIPLLYIFTPRFFSALVIVSFPIIIFLPFTILYLDSKLYISISLSNSNLYVKRTFIRKTKKFILAEVKSIIISICDIKDKEKYAPVIFNINIVTIFGEKNYKFIKYFSVPKERNWPLEVTKKMSMKFKEKLHNLADIFPNYIYVEEKAPILKKRAYLISHLKDKI